MVLLALLLLAQPTAVRATRMFDARRGAIVQPGLVVVDGERIVQVGGAAPAGARTIDLGNATPWTWSCAGPRSRLSTQPSTRAGRWSRASPPSATSAPGTSSTWG